MIKMILITATVLAASLVGTVQARMTTGYDLMQHCVDAPDSFCAGYIGGVIDTNHAMFCIPSKVTKREMINIIIMYLRDRSENKLGLYAPKLVPGGGEPGRRCKDDR